MKQSLKFLLISVLLLSTQANAAKTVSLENKIGSLYISFFNRAPDYSGLSYWNTTGTNVVNAGGTALETLKQLSAGFAGHPTFTSTYNGMDDETFVNAIYNNALGRDGDAGGINYWKGLLTSGKSRSDMVAEFMEISLTADLDNDPQYASLSAADKAAAQERQDLITNKVEAAVYFTNTLGENTNLDDATDAMDPASLANDAAYLASQKVIADVGLESASVTNSKGKVRTLAYDQSAISSINASWASLVVGDSSKPIYTTHWLNGRTLYEVYKEQNEWFVSPFIFTDTTWTAYELNSPTEREENISYTITEDGYITFTAPWDNNPTTYIKIVEEAADYQTLCWREDISSIEQCTGDDEYFYFDLEIAKAVVATKNAELTPVAPSYAGTYVGTYTATDSNYYDCERSGSVTFSISESNGVSGTAYGEYSYNVDGTISSTGYYSGSAVGGDSSSVWTAQASGNTFNGNYIDSGWGCAGTFTTIKQ